MTGTPPFRPRLGRCAIVLLDGFQILDMSGPAAVLEVASRIAGDTRRIEIVAGNPGLVRSSSGVAVLAQPLGDPGRVDTLIVTGAAERSGDVIDASLLAFVQECALRARRVTSICTGAFVLAAAGLLDGHTATTHWEDAHELARCYPRVKVEPDRIYVRSGHIWTSAGVTAGIDLALALVAEDYGEAVARATAQNLVVPLRRLGGQSQFSGMIELQRPEARFAELLHAVRSDLSENHGVEQLAARAGMSTRNFARAFRAETGVSPAKAVERLRCEHARAMLHSKASVKEAARLCGFGDIERMRRAFRRTFGTAPAAFKFAPDAL